MPDDDRIPRRILDYVRRSVPEPPERPLGTVSEQAGSMRLAPERDWMPFTAEQTMSACETAFRWHARFKIAPLVTGVVEDAYENGKGRLDAKVWGVVPIARARGLDVDRGEAQRYLAELVWCPLALLHNPALRYRVVNEATVRVSSGNDETQVDLVFDEGGDVRGVRTGARPRGETLEPWGGRFSEPRDFGGIRAPSRAEVWWETPDGRFVYWRAAITALSWAT